MCHCLSFLLANPTLEQKWVAWTKSLSLLCRRFQSWAQSLASPEVELLRTVSAATINAPDNHNLQHKHTSTPPQDACLDVMLQKCGIYVVRKRRHVQPVNVNSEYAAMAEENLEEMSGNLTVEVASRNEDSTIRGQISEVMKQDEAISNDSPPKKSLSKTITNGGDESVSLFTQQGLKGINQDSMLVWENFISSEKSIFCAVFDGHGPHGHLVSRAVRDKLPAKVVSCWRALQLSCLMAKRNDYSPPEKFRGFRGNHLAGDLDTIPLWEECFHNAFKLMDRELLMDEDVDCVFSGTTAVTLVKQGHDLIIANVGDSRAVLGVKFKNSLIPLQLTVDLTPNLPKEAERIRRFRGRVLALRTKPSVKRVWLPHENTPGLAMARAFGDYILKNHGVISVPEVTHRQLSVNDKFVVLATDGVWDVLSNEQVVHIVDATPARSQAAKAVVEAAAGAWKLKYPDAKADDCAVVCLFLDSLTQSWGKMSSGDDDDKTFDV